MPSNTLKLNDKKTEALLIGTKHYLRDIPVTSVVVGNASIPFADCVRNLGTIFDSQLTMELQIDKLCKTCYYHLRCVSEICHFIRRKSARRLAQTRVHMSKYTFPKFPQIPITCMYIHTH